jgi:hypothetical protein
MKTLIVAALIVLGGCATADRHLAFDQDEVDARAAQRTALEEWCRMIGPCEEGRGGLIPLAPLPPYTEECGYLPPVYGSDC